MPTKEDMRSLAQGIIGAYDARVADIALLRSGVATQLKGLDAGHQAMARQQRADLAKGHQDLRSGVATQLKGLNTAHTEAHRGWQNMAATLGAKRGHATAMAKPVAPAEVREVTPELTDLRDRVFGYLANHPDGTRLAELEHEFGLSRLQAARVVGGLMDDGKVEKRELLYFAI